MPIGETHAWMLDLEAVCHTTNIKRERNRGIDQEKARKTEKRDKGIKTIN